MDIKDEPATVPSEEQYFHVKKIIDWDMDHDGHYYYKVKWEPSWEPADNLRNCDDLIEEFWSFFYRGTCHASNQVDGNGFEDHPNGSRESRKSQVRITLREEIFAGINFREFFFRTFRGN